MRRWHGRSSRADVARAALVLVASFAPGARGETPVLVPAPAGAVVVVADRADAPIVPLLRAELETLGMRVELAEHASGEPAPHELNAVARRHQAVAAIRVLVASGLVEIWIADRVTGKVVFRDLPGDGGTRFDETLAAVRAVELLRGSLIELEAPHPPRGELPPPPALRALARGERFAMDVAGGGLWSEGGATVAPVITVSLIWHVWRHAGLRLGGLAPLAPAVIRGAEGSAELALRGVDLQALALTAPAAGRWRASVGLGLGLYALSMVGRPAAPYAGGSDTIWSLAPTAGAALGCTVAGPVRAVLGAWAASMLSFARVQFATHQVGRYGALLGGATVALEVGWP